MSNWVHGFRPPCHRCRQIKFGSRLNPRKPPLLECGPGRLATRSTTPALVETTERKHNCDRVFPCSAWSLSLSLTAQVCRWMNSWCHYPSTSSSHPVGFEIFHAGLL